MRFTEQSSEHRRRIAVGGAGQCQFGIRAGVTEVDEPLESVLTRAVSFTDQRCGALGFQRAEAGLQRGDVEAVQPLLAGAHVVVFDLGEQHAERAEQSR